MPALISKIPKDIRAAVKGIQRRDNAVIADAVVNDDDKRTVTLSLASETPYLRFFGWEVLDCQAASVDLARLPGGIPLLRNHDVHQHIGRFESITVDEDKVVRAVVRFSSVAAAQDAYTMVKEGILCSVSVGYEIEEMILESEENDIPTYRALRWTILEGSLVSVPADSTVGIGRSNATVDPAKAKKIMAALRAKRAKELVADEEDTPADETGKPADEAKPVDETDKPADEAATDTEEVPAEDTDKEKDTKRAADITAAGRATRNEDMAREYIANGRSLEDFKKAVLQKQKAPAAIHIQKEKKMTNQEIFAMALRQVCEGKEAHGAVKEVVDQAQSDFPELYARSVTRSKGGVFLPAGFLARDYGLTNPAGTGVGSVQGAVLTTATGPLIQHTFDANILGALGVQEFNVTNGAILKYPRDMVAEMTFGHGERTVAPEHNDTLKDIDFQPHRFTVQSKFTTMALLQSGIDLMGHAQAKMAIAYELGKQKYFFGDGFGNDEAPVGLAGLGINAVTGNYAGARNTIIDAISDIEEQNAPVPKLAMNSKTLWNLAKVAIGSNGEYLAQPFLGSFTVLGLQVVISNAIPTGEIWMGDFSETAVVNYGAMAIYADHDYASGKRMVILEGFLDVGAMKEELISLVKLS